MIILTAVVAIVFGLAAFCRDTPLGHVLYELLVEEPARRMNRGALAATAQIVAMMILASFVIAAPIAPELIPLAVSVDFALFVEVAALLFVARAGGWARSAPRLIARWPKRAASWPFRPPGRSRPHRPRRRRPRAAPGDPEPWPWAFA